MCERDTLTPDLSLSTWALDQSGRLTEGGEDGFGVPTGVGMCVILAHV